MEKYENYNFSNNTSTLLNSLVQCEKSFLKTEQIFLNIKQVFLLQLFLEIKSSNIMVCNFVKFRYTLHSCARIRGIQLRCTIQDNCTYNFQVLQLISYILLSFCAQQRSIVFIMLCLASCNHFPRKLVRCTHRLYSLIQEFLSLLDFAGVNPTFQRSYLQGVNGTVS